MTNPYAPPSTDDVATDHWPISVREARSFAIVTVLIVCANSLVPLFFASFVTDTSARTGMVAGLAVTLIASVGLGIHIPRLRPALTKGGTAIALSQLLPLAQLLAGSVAMFCCIKVGLAEDYHDDHPAGYLRSAAAGFACTTITATILSGLALLVGFPLSRNERILD